MSQYIRTSVTRGRQSDEERSGDQARSREGSGAAREEWYLVYGKERSRMAKERRDRSKRGEEAVRRREEAERRRGEEHRGEYSGEEGGVRRVRQREEKERRSVKTIGITNDGPAPAPAPNRSE